MLKYLFIVTMSKIYFLMSATGKLDVPSFTLITTKNTSEILEQMKRHGVEFPFGKELFRFPNRTNS